MPLPIIDEEAILGSFSTTNNGSRPLGHNTIYGIPSDDNTSIFSHSTNSTVSNLPGPGRVLGNAYSFAGKRLERTLGNLAHKAGFSPEAVYQRICTLYLEDWKIDGKKASMLQKLCFKLLKQTKSIADSTRFMAIMRWRDILQDQHEIYVWLFSSEQERMVKHASALLRVIEEHQLAINTLSDFQDAVLSETSLLINFHSVGINVINLNRARLLTKGGSFHLNWTGAADIHGEEIEKWDVSFKYLLESLSDPTISVLSRWYIDFWSSQTVEGNMHLQIALQSCRTLQCVLKAVNPPQIDGLDALQGLCKAVFTNLIRRFDSDALLLDEGAHISSTLNGLTKLHDRVFSPKLGSVPNLAGLTMLGSTDLISADVKGNIRGILKDLQNDDKGKDTAFTEMMFLRSCKKLLKRALSELDDTDCINKLSNATSFTDGTGRCALLQLGDILQSLPEVYMLLITLYAYETRDFVVSIRQSLKVMHYSGILMALRSLLACHATGLSLVAENTTILRVEVMVNFITRTGSSNDKARELFMSYLMDNVTFNILIFYLKHCISQIRRVEYIWNYEHSFLSCSVVQGALLTEKSVPQEERSAMEELCRTMQSSIIERLRCSVEYYSGYFVELRPAMWSVYRDLTKSKQAFADEAEVYLSQLCNECFNIILKAKAVWSTLCVVHGLSDFFQLRNVFGWFLSNRGLDAEESIFRLLEDTRLSQPFSTWNFPYLEAHKLGVALLAPRHEKLRLEGAGLTRHVPPGSSEPPLTLEQRERWTNAFETLAANLWSSNSDLEDISLFYFAHCPLPYETNSMLYTASAVHYCKYLRLVLMGYQQLSKEKKEDLSRAVSHIHTCLTKRVEFVQRSCTDLALDEAPNFYSTPFDIPKVVKVLNDLATLSKELRSDAPELLPVHD